MTTTIDDLSQAATVTDDTIFPAWVNGDTRGVTAEALASYLGGVGNIGVAPTEYTRVVVSPAMSPFEVDVAAAIGHIWLIISPAEPMAVGTVNLPALEDCINGQELTISATFPITSLTLDGGDANIIGEPGAIAADGFFRLRFDAALETWFRVG